MWHDTHQVFIGACVIALLAALPAVASERADEDVGATLVDDLTAALRAKETADIGTCIERIADAYPEIEDDDVRSRLVKAVGKASRFKSDDVRRDALRAFGTMGDPDAWRYLSRFLKQSDRDLEPALFSDAIRAVEQIAPDGAVRALLHLVRKSRHLGVASRAMQALGAFGASRHREAILEEIVDTTRKERPGVKGRENPNYWGPRQTGEAARNRWEALARPMVRTANRLTGQEIRSVTEWFEIVGDNRRDLEVLFEAAGADDRAE